jgi:hypothetical protein
LKCKPETHEHVLHSSFYIHKLHRKAESNVTDNRVYSRSRYLSSQDDSRTITKNIAEEVRGFNKCKMKQNMVEDE